MTREEAIQYIDGLHVVPCEQLKEFCDERNEAIDIAIAALSVANLKEKFGTADSEQVTGKLKKTCDSLLTDDSAECKEQKSKLDLISRAGALRELNGACSNWEDDAKVAEIIHALPSAELPKGELISRADAIEAVCKGCHWWSGQCDNDKAFRCDEVCRIEALPSADAEPINCVKCKHYYETEDDTDAHGRCRMDTAHTELVRCNECKWYQGVHGVQGHAPCEYFNKQVLWNDFCSNGEPYKGGDIE